MVSPEFEKIREQVLALKKDIERLRENSFLAVIKEDTPSGWPKWWLQEKRVMRELKRAFPELEYYKYYEHFSGWKEGFRWQEKSGVSYINISTKYMHISFNLYDYEKETNRLIYPDKYAKAWAFAYGKYHKYEHKLGYERVEVYIPTAESILKFVEKRLKFFEKLPEFVRELNKIANMYDLIVKRREKDYRKIYNFSLWSYDEGNSYELLVNHNGGWGDSQITMGMLSLLDLEIKPKDWYWEHC